MDSSVVFEKNTGAAGVKISKKLKVMNEEQLRNL